MISRFFIDRPVLANVLALVFVLIGLVALLQLPTAEYPNVVPPTIQVSTRYAGASAQTLVDTVALVAVPVETETGLLQASAAKQNQLASPAYREQQETLIQEGTHVVSAPAPHDADDDLKASGGQPGFLLW